VCVYCYTTMYIPQFRILKESSQIRIPNYFVDGFHSVDANLVMQLMSIPV